MEGSPRRKEGAIGKIKEYGIQRSRSILNDLRDKKISRESAIKHLEYSGVYGLFACGRLNVQEAYDNPSLSESMNYLLKATELFERTIEESTILNKGRVESLSSNAKLQLAYIPVHEIFFHEEFPNESLAQHIHIQTINTAYDLLMEESNWKREPYEAAGTLGELGVLAILQRLAIQTIGSNIYFPSPSTYDQDNNNPPGHTINNSWDVNLYGDVGHGLDLVSRIQVKTSDTYSDGTMVMPVHSGIKLVCLDPHLRLDSEYDSVARQVIKDLVLEQDFPRDSEEYINASERLNTRTQILLDIID